MTWLDRIRPGDRAWWLALVLAAVFFAAHVPFLASTLEDIDSINFALGVRDFDPGRHRPHPPGYPVYIALAKAARVVLSESRALAVWSAIFGALAAFPLIRLFRALDSMDDPGGDARKASSPSDAWLSPAALATLVTVTSPLYWMTGVRPMSDLVGLALALLSQALLATAYVRQFTDIPDVRGRFDAAAAARSGRLILLGALVAAFAIGARSQALWLTLPLLVGVLAARVGRGAAGALIGSAVWFAAGVTAWLVPLVIASGGPAKYIAALTAQAGEDWTGIDLLVTEFSARRLAVGLYETLIPHWAGLGWLVLALAVLGAVGALWSSRRACLFLAAAFVPYAVFHLLFQELVTTRYALPLVPAVVYLAVRGARLLGRVPAVAIALLFVAVSLAQVVPVTAAYAAAGSPVSRAIADANAEALRSGHAVLGRHYPFARALEADINPTQILVLETPPRMAWLELARHVVDDGGTALWFFESPLRTDLALIDQHALQIRASYRWPFRTSVYLGGVRPSDVDWLQVSRPGWVALEGWHLTPETAGLAVAGKKGLGAGPITALVRRRAGDAVAMIGGRNLGGPGQPDLDFTLRVDGRAIESWTAAADPAFFLRVVRLPAGVLTGEGQWAKVTIEARRIDSGQFSAVGAVEQFDLQDAGVLLAGYDAGWHERELNPATGVLWRWTSSRAALRIEPATRDVVLQVTGETPMRNFVRPSRVVVRAGDVELLRTGVAADFAWSLHISAAALAASGGIVTVETDQVFRPADRQQNADRRALGLRVFTVTVKPVS